MKDLENAKVKLERSPGSAWEINFPKTTEEAYIELMKLKIKEFWDNIEPVKDTKPLDDFLNAFISDEYDKGTRERIKTLFKKWFVLLYKNSLSDDKFKTLSNVLLILTGGQQIGKTRFIHHLLPPELHISYTHFPDKSSERAFNKALLTRILIHFDDAVPTFRRKDWEKIKFLITEPYAVWTPRYSDTFIAEKRTASYVATTNEAHFLPEDEGLCRRVFVVKVRYYDPELLPAPEVFWGIIKYIAQEDIRYYWASWGPEERDFFAELAKEHIK